MTAMLTLDSLTDDQIRELEIEAERTMDPEWILVCHLAYRNEGRGNCHPLARSRVVQLFNERTAWGRTE